MPGTRQSSVDKHGSASIAIPQEIWRDYLDWYRDVLKLPVENEVEVTSIEPAGDLLLAHLRREAGSNASMRERSSSRPASMAADAGGRQALVANLPAERYAHTADDINFRRLAGKRVGVLGVGASAFDNAAAALEAGAARVDLCFRRADIPRVNPLIWTNFAGMLGHFARADRPGALAVHAPHSGGASGPPPQDSFLALSQVSKISRGMPIAGGTPFATKETSQRLKPKPAPSRLISSFSPQASRRTFGPSELAPIVHQIALWRDRFTPPPGEESDLLASYPYLGTAFEFTEREPGTAPYLSRLHNFTFGATPSLGLTGAAITGMKYGVPRLVNGLVRDLFREDAAAYYGTSSPMRYPNWRTSKARLMDRPPRRRSDQPREKFDRSSRSAVLTKAAAGKRASRHARRKAAQRATSCSATQRRGKLATAGYAYAEQTPTAARR